MREQGTYTSEKIKAMIGIPSVHGFCEMATYVVSLRLDKISEAMTEAMKLWKTQEGWLTVHKHIKHCRVSNMYHSTHKGLEGSCPLALVIRPTLPTYLLKEIPSDVNQLTPTWAWLVISELLKQETEYQALEGIAPAGDLARKVQEYIDGSDAKK